MSSTTFHLSTAWRVRGTVDDVYTLLSRPEDFVHWWAPVYLNVQELSAGDADGVGRTLALRTRGKLPYTLNWQARALERERPHRMVIEAQGDLEGRGEWFLSQDGDWVDARYDWTVRITRPWMQLLSPLLKPVYEANHRWAMRRGEEGLQRELARHAARPG